jgi:hypothetical protein
VALPAALAGSTTWLDRLSGQPAQAEGGGDSLPLAALLRSLTLALLVRRTDG